MLLVEEKVLVRVIKVAFFLTTKINNDHPLQLFNKNKKKCSIFRAFKKYGLLIGLNHFSLKLSYFFAGDKTSRVTNEALVMLKLGRIPR